MTFGEPPARSDSSSQRSHGSADPAAAPAYAVTVGDVSADRSTVLALWRGHIDDAAHVEAKYEWFYSAHPHGPSAILLLRSGADQTPVGTAGIGGRQMRAHGVAHRAGIFADLLVLPAHRTLFPAMLLQREITRVGLARHSVVFGVPNEKAVPLFRRIGYTHLGDLVRYVVVLRYGDQLRRRLPAWLAIAAGVGLDRIAPAYRRLLRGASGGLAGAWVDGVDPRADALWERAQSFAGVIGVRDAEYLRWRFFTRPGHDHRMFVVARSGDATISGYAVCERAGQTLHVRDMLVDPALRNGMSVLVGSLANRAYHDGYSTLSLDFMGGEVDRRALRTAGMTEREGRPVFASFAPAHADALRGLDWYVTRADIDA